MDAMSAMWCFSGAGAGTAQSALLRLRNGPFASVLSKLTSLFKACNINIRHSYLISSLPMVSAEDEENDI